MPYRDTVGVTGDRSYASNTKKGYAEHRQRMAVMDKENFHPQSEPLFPIIALREKWEEFEEMIRQRPEGHIPPTPYEFFIFLLKQSKP
jgi:hypothetical protein